MMDVDASRNASKLIVKGHWAMTSSAVHGAARAAFTSVTESRAAIEEPRH